MFHIFFELFLAIFLSVKKDEKHRMIQELITTMNILADYSSLFKILPLIEWLHS